MQQCVGEQAQSSRGLLVGLVQGAGREGQVRDHLAGRGRSIRTAESTPTIKLKGPHRGTKERTDGYFICMLCLWVKISQETIFANPQDEETP